MPCDRELHQAHTIYDSRVALIRKLKIIMHLGSCKSRISLNLGVLFNCRFVIYDCRAYLDKINLGLAERSLLFLSIGN